jgi:hypothetical protein
MTPEEQLIQRYFDAFNRHDIEGVIWGNGREAPTRRNRILKMLPEISVLRIAPGSFPPKLALWQFLVAR